MSDFEVRDDLECIRCGCGEIRERDCTSLMCDGGRVDLHEIDPLFHPPGETEACMECLGKGVEIWCPQCGGGRFKEL